MFLAIYFTCYCHAQAQGTAFSYQGRLDDGGTAANGNYDFRFTLHQTTNLENDVVASPLTNLNTSVAQGLFTVFLDFGTGVYAGNSLWLQLEVRTNGGAVFVSLSPRQALLPVPYAVFAEGASNVLGRVAVTQLSGPLPATQLTGTVSVAQLPSNVLTNGSANVVLRGIFSGNGAGLTNINNLSANAPYTYSQSTPALALWTVADDSSVVPLFSVSQDYGDPNIDGTVATWGYNLADNLTYNAGRFFGASWNWELQNPGGDPRSLVLKAAASQTQNQGAYFILETAAASSSPGTHGLFNNSMYVSRRGLTALGNLTDNSD
jgi:hypothetical protein